MGKHDTAAPVNQPRSPAVFVDRDGCLNQVVLREGKPYAPSSVKDLVILPGVAEALGNLRRSGFKIIVVTNQPDVAKGIQTRQVVEKIHEVMAARLPLDAIKVCYHVDSEDCSCRKPKPGMLLEAAQQWSLDLNRSFMIGDRWRDIEAGKAAGCKTIWIDNGYNERKAENADGVVHSLAEASDFILKRLQKHG